MKLRQGKVVLVAAMAMLVAGSVVSAQEPSSLSLGEALAIAGQENPGMLAAAAMAESAEGGIQVAKAKLLPTLSLTASYNSLDGDAYFARLLAPPQPGQPPAEGVDVGEFDSTTLAILNLSQVIYAGGAHRAAVAGSRLEAQIASAELQGQQLDLDLAVTRAYYTTLLATRRLEVAGKNITRSEENLAVVKRRLAEEEALQAELLGAEAHLAADRHGLLQAENAASLSRLALSQLLGRDLPADVRLTDSLDGPEFQLSQEECVSRALDATPRLQAAGLRRELAVTQLARARALRKPKLELQGLYSWLDNEMLFKGTYYGVALNLSIPFLQDFTAGAGALGQARAQLSAAKSQQRDQESQVRLAVGQAIRRLQESYLAIVAAEKNLAYHREQHRVTESAFQEQLVTFADVLDNHVDLSQAELALVGAQYEARIAEAELKKIIGER